MLVKWWQTLSSIWKKEGNLQLFPKWSSEHWFLTEAPSAGLGELELQSFRLAFHVAVSYLNGILRPPQTRLWIGVYHLVKIECNSGDKIPFLTLRVVLPNLKCNLPCNTTFLTFPKHLGLEWVFVARAGFFSYSNTSVLRLKFQACCCCVLCTRLPTGFPVALGLSQASWSDLPKRQWVTDSFAQCSLIIWSCQPQHVWLLPCQFLSCSPTSEGNKYLHNELQ